MSTSALRLIPALALATLALAGCGTTPHAPGTISQAPAPSATASASAKVPGPQMTTVPPTAQVSTAAPSTTPEAPQAPASSSAPAQTAPAQPAPATTAPAPAQTTAAPAPQTTAPAAATREVCLPTENLCFDLPAGWTLPSQQGTTGGGRTSDLATLKDPSGKPVLYISAVTNGWGGGCQNPPWTDYVIAATKTKLTGYPLDWEQASDTAYVSETVTENPDGTYTPYVYLTTNKLFQQPGQFKNCQLWYSNIIRGSQGKDPNNSVVFDLHSWGATDPNQPVIKRSMATKDEAAKYFDTAEAKATAAILGSAHYRK